MDIKILLLSLAVGSEYKRITNPCIKTIENYANKHNLSFKLADECYKGKRPPAWYKIKAIKKYLNDYDWIVWLDSDIVITNNNFNIFEFINKFKEKKVIIGKDFNNVNSGVMFWKSCKSNLELLDEIWSKKYCINHYWLEQKAIIDMIEAGNKDFHILDESDSWIINASTKNFKNDSWLIHFAGFKNNKLKNKIEKYINLKNRDYEQKKFFI